jgi:hypothetical protein
MGSARAQIRQTCGIHPTECSNTWTLFTLALRSANTSPTAVRAVRLGFGLGHQRAQDERRRFCVAVIGAYAVLERICGEAVHQRDAAARLRDGVQPLRVAHAHAPCTRRFLRTISVKRAPPSARRNTTQAHPGISYRGASWLFQPAATRRVRGRATRIRVPVRAVRLTGCTKQTNLRDDPARAHRTIARGRTAGAR